MVEMGALEAGSWMSVHEKDSTPRLGAVLRVPELSSIQEEKSVRVVIVETGTRRWSFLCGWRWSAG